MNALRTLFAAASASGLLPWICCALLAAFGAVGGAGFTPAITGGGLELRDGKTRKPRRRTTTRARRHGEGTGHE